MADIKKIKLLDNTEYNLVDASATHIQTVTLAQWNALTPQQQASGDYVISDATFVPLSADLIPYDNTTSGLTADDVQEAIDEIAQGGVVGELNDLSDVTISNVSGGDSLVYNGANSEWENKQLTWEGTQAQYDALTTKDPSVDYYITDSGISSVGLGDLSGVSIDTTTLTNSDILSYDSVNAVWNNVRYPTAENIMYSSTVTVKSAIDSKANTSSLATVATSGSYSDLSNKPTIPTDAEQLPITSGSATNTKDYIDGRTPIYTGGHATDLSTTGLSTGTYLYKYDSTTNGIPQAGGEGDCYITINNTQSYGCELAVSDRGLFWRNKVNQAWGSWLDISGKLTVHSGMSTGTVGVNSTYQIPANVLGHTLIIVSARRQGLGNSSIFEKSDLLARDNGFMLAASLTSYCIIKCSTTGLLTVTNLTGMSDVYISVMGIF